MFRVSKVNTLWVVAKKLKKTKNVSVEIVFTHDYPISSNLNLECSKDVSVQLYLFFYNSCKKGLYSISICLYEYLKCYTFFNVLKKIMYSYVIMYLW